MAGARPEAVRDTGPRRQEADAAIAVTFWSVHETTDDPHSKLMEALNEAGGRWFMVEDVSRKTEERGKIEKIKRGVEDPASGLV